ncbi:hypothetical protein AVDCRST_MAG81-1722 [uncultured Synechococcales cyanobacterium]|uniref:Uncharacterized protein n=1 Tax=uncultured Synechococcales cyanobacterium TaxID=1936017 RepID=A0A6J4V9C6_9CYAN|nr:hypothetical protein AVDCRST_MAG81-1722 [uncultured Synechococcales cyanobacterium]
MEQATQIFIIHLYFFEAIPDMAVGTNNPKLLPWILKREVE